MLLHSTSSFSILSELTCTRFRDNSLTRSKNSDGYSMANPLIPAPSPLERRTKPVLGDGKGVRSGIIKTLRSLHAEEKKIFLQSFTISDMIFPMEV